MEGGSEHSIPSAHAGRALGGASCVLGGGRALTWRSRRHPAQERPEERRFASLCGVFGGWLGLLLLLFCFVFYEFGCKTCAEPPERVLSKRAPLLT